MKAIEQNQPSLVRNKIIVSDLEFFSSDEVSLIGQIEMHGEMVPCQYLTNKKNLYLILKDSGKVGQEIIYMIMEKFKRPHSSVINFNLKEIFGRPVSLDKCLVKLDRSFFENECGEWKIDYDSNLFFIDCVKPLEKEEIPSGLF